jgi:hypothetical protein
MGMADRVQSRGTTSWGARLLAGLGFLLALACLAVFISYQVVMLRAEDYLKERYHANIDVPVKRVRPEFLKAAAESERPLPPLGFCWVLELDGGKVAGEVTVNPWTHEVLNWSTNIDL